MYTQMGYNCYILPPNFKMVKTIQIGPGVQKLEANVHTDGLQLLHLSLDEANVHTDGLQLLHFASQFQNGKNHPNRTRGSKVRG